VLAEREGFEPPESSRSSGFQAGAAGRAEGGRASVDGAEIGPERLVHEIRFREPILGTVLREITYLVETGILDDSERLEPAFGVFVRDAQGKREPSGGQPGDGVPGDADGGELQARSGSR
jgi:hypothetical protein